MIPVDLIADAALTAGSVSRARRVRPAPSIGLFWGRPDRSARLGDTLRRRGFDVVHYNVRGHGEEPFVPIPASPFGACLRLLRTDHDVYLASLWFVPALCVYVNARLRDRPYVVNCTGVMWEMYRDRSRGKPFARLFERHVYPALTSMILRDASAIVCNSRFLASRIARRYPQHAGRITTIYNGIDMAKYAGGRRISPPGVPHDAPVVLCVTSLNFDAKSRGVEVVIDAFGQVHRRRPDARLVIAAKAADPRYPARVAEIASARPWADAITLLENHPDVPGLLARADVFAYATPDDSNDSLPRALLEAQSAGVPVVTTGTSGCAEIVGDGTTGFVVPYRAEPMAERIHELLGNAILRSDLGAAARIHMNERFSWDAMADAYAALFRKIAEHR